MWWLQDYEHLAPEIQASYLNTSNAPWPKTEGHLSALESGFGRGSNNVAFRWASHYSVASREAMATVTPKLLTSAQLPPPLVYNRLPNWKWGEQHVWHAKQPSKL